MKKTLSLVLSLMMILATLTALPFTAHASNVTINKVDLNYYFDNGDKINFVPSTTGQHFEAYSVQWEDQNGQPFNNNQINADPNETYTVTVAFTADTGYEFWENISVDFNGVRLKNGGTGLLENEYKLTTMNYELQLTVTFRYLTAMVKNVTDFRYSQYIDAYSGFYIKDQELELEAPEYDDNYHFDKWEAQGDFTVNYPRYSYTKAYMGTTPASLFAYYTAHTWDEGTVTKEATITEEGEKTFKCVCGVNKTEAIAKLPKLANTLTAKGKTVKIKKNKKVTIKKAKAFAISNAQGTVTFKKAKGNKKITVAKNGKITVKKGLKKGTYKVKIKVTAAGNATYKAATKTVTVTIKVK